MDQFIHILDVAQKLGYVLLMILAVVAMLVFPKAVKPTLMQDLLESLEKQAHRAVASVQQSFVDDLKDPGKPGKWDSTTAAIAHTRAEELLRKLGKNELTQLTQLDPKFPIGNLLETLIESAVNHYKRTAPVYEMITDQINTEEPDEPTDPKPPTRN